MGVKLFLIRHGQTLWNEEGRYQGDRDIGLTRLGIRQAKLAAKADVANPKDCGSGPRFPECKRPDRQSKSRI